MSRENLKKKRSLCLVDVCRNEGKHLFPKDEKRKAQWVQTIIHFKPGLTLKKHSRICSAHFKPTDFIITPLSLLQPNVAPKRLKKTAIPSIFPWKTAFQPQSENQDSSSYTASSEPTEHQKSQTLNLSQIQKTYACTPPISFVEEQLFFNTTPCEPSEDPLKCGIENAESDAEHTQPSSEYVSSTNIEVGEQLRTEIDIVADLELNQSEEIIVEECSLDNREYHDECVQTNDISIIPKMHDSSTQTQDKGMQSIHYYKNNDKAIHFYTGLENFKKLLFVFQTLGQCVNKLNYFYEKPPKKLDALEQYFITILILRRHKPFEEIAFMFGITIKQVYNIFITWIRFMSLQWKNIDLWLDKDSVRAYMPVDFYDKFPSTRVVLDATECPVKKPKLPIAQQVTFSMYKNRNTIKFLIGITPSGMISYVSPCYGGSATDRQIIERSSLLGKFDYNDEIMVDKGLNVQDIFMPYGVKVNMPSFFKKGNQIAPDILLSNRKVASKRVHVERIIGLLKTYKILCQPLNQTETILSSDIVFVCAMLVNFRSSIVNKSA